MRVKDFPFDLQECAIKLQSQFPAVAGGKEAAKKRFHGSLFDPGGVGAREGGGRFGAARAGQTSEG